MSRPKILALITNLDFGGAQRVFRAQNLVLGERYAVEEAVFNTEAGRAFPSGKKLNSLEVGGGGGVVIKLRNFRRRVSRLAALKRSGRFDICISHLEGADYVNLLSKQKEKIIICVHGSKLHDPSMAGWRGVLRKRILIPLLYNLADAIVTVSRGIASELTQLGIDAAKVRTINNFFPIDEIETAAAEPLSEPEQRLYDSGSILVTSGRLVAGKNHALLLDMFASLRRAHPASKLVFLGDGDLREALLGRSRSLEQRTYDAWSGAPLTPDFDVYFLGMKENPFKYIRGADLFVFPSEWEGFPLALGEAMICGAPVITTDCRTGPREILAPDLPVEGARVTTPQHGEFGVLMPVLNDPTTLERNRGIWVETLAQLLDDPAERRRISKGGRKRMEDFSREKMAGRWLELVDELLQEAPAAS